MNLIITGDLVIDTPYSITGISNEVIDLFKQSDLNIVNLEAPITDSTRQILKTGPHLKADTESTSLALRALNINVVTLGNNHVLDYGQQGVEDTLIFCRENDIQTVGAGMGLKEAAEPLFVDSEDGKIAFVNFAENEWTNATAATAGANPMDIIDNLKQIQEAKKKANFVLVIVHGGNEYSHYPSPRMVKQYRFYAESGADAVIGHHTHCVSGHEKHQGVPIFYSLGNFLFTTQKNKLDSWYSGLVLKLNIQKGKSVEFEVIPVSQAKGSHALRITTGNDKKNVFDMISEVNKVIRNDELLEEKWNEFVQKIQSGFIKSIFPIAGIKNRYIRGLLYRTSLYKLLLNKRYLKEHLNRIRCEAHYDVTKEILKEYINN